MPNGKRIVDGRALWESDKLLKISDQFRGEYANLLPLANDHGVFDPNPAKVHHSVYGYNRKNITEDDVKNMITEFVDAGMIERFEFEGKEWAYFVGGDNKGRLPPPSERNSSDYPKRPQKPTSYTKPTPSVGTTYGAVPGGGRDEGLGGVRRGSLDLCDSEPDEAPPKKDIELLFKKWGRAIVRITKRSRTLGTLKDHRTAAAWEKIYKNNSDEVIVAAAEIWARESKKFIHDTEKSIAFLFTTQADKFISEVIEGGEIHEEIKQEDERAEEAAEEAAETGRVVAPRRRKTGGAVMKFDD